MKAPRLFSARSDVLARLLPVSPEVVGAALAALALLLAFFDGVTGVNAPFAGGHFASSAAIGVGAHNMWRLHTVLPVLGYFDTAPFNPNYYMHHPLGVFWTVAALGKVFGFSNWVLRLPPIIYVTLTPYFLYRIGREVWGPVEGGLSALAFVALPITIGYANYHDLEQPVMFGCVVATWGYARFVRTWKERYALASIAGFFFALNHDWQGYIWGAFFLGWLFLRGFVLPERFVGCVRPRTFGRYWALMAAAAVIAFAIELYVLQESGQMSDVLGSASGRTAGNSTPLSLVLASRSYRIELMFTGLAILLGKVAAPLIAVRALIRRDELELLPLPLLLSAVVQYVVFKQGADIHIFWPHSFAAYFGLAVGALAASARDGLGWLRARVPPEAQGASFARQLGPWVGLVLLGVPTLLVLRDGLSICRLARETGGRFAENNLDLRVDVAQALRWFRARVPAESPIAYHTSVPTSWALQWETRPAAVSSNVTVAAVAPPIRTYILDSRGTSVADLRAAASRFHVHVVDAFWLVDPKEPAGPLAGYRFAEHEPSLLDGLSQGRVEPVRAIVPDPFVTWEWRTLVGQTALPPAAAPITLEQIRIAHNAAVVRTDGPAVARWRGTLAAGLDWPVHAKFDNQTELLGAVRHRGAQRGFTFYFLAGVFKVDAKFAVHARVVTPPRLSTLPVDPLDLDLSTNPVVPTTLWRPGHIYSVTVVFRKRPGHEQLTGAWTGGIRRTDAPSPIDIGRF